MMPLGPRVIDILHSQIDFVSPDRLRIHGVLERRGTPCFDRLGRGSVECHATRRIRTLGHLTQWSD